ncbi:MAG: aminomethyl-transferring glycine dehydrogenase subunit GcvPB [Nocardioidaceae bacterium]
MSVREHYHQASWDEPLITELGSPGQRGIVVSPFDGPAAGPLPDSARRSAPPALPELGQAQVLKHYMRLSQMCLGHNIAIDATVGTTTPKYPPVVNELIARDNKLAELHPAQPDASVQGVLELLWELGEALKALSGMDAVSMQPGGGAHGIFTNVMMMRAYHLSRGDTHRDEYISSITSHPTSPASAAALGFKVIEVPPGPNGYVELEAIRAAVSDRTAGVLLNNPEDTGVFNQNIADIAQIVHDAGGLCSYDQANANATLGLARARESGFDLCQFNMHKTFGAPMNIFGPAATVSCVTSELAEFLPSPVVVKTDSGFALDRDRPHSVGPVRAWNGNVPSLVKAYAWICAFGEEWIREVSRTAVLNNNYVKSKLEKLPGFSIAFADNQERRLDLVRYSVEKLREDTGIGGDEINLRLVDYGLPSHFNSHHPHTSPDPVTIEPTESFDRAELDEVADVYARIVDEAYNDVEKIAAAPQRAAVGQWRLDLLSQDSFPAMNARMLREQQAATS